MNLKFWQRPIAEVVNEVQTQNVQEELIKEPLERVRGSLKYWGEAVDDAENPFMPESIRYQNLLNIYRNIELDPHISAITETILNRIAQTPFQVTDKSGEIDEEKTAFFKTSWFLELVKYIIDADYWGFSLIQITDIKDGKIKKIENINRFYIRPEAEGVAQNLWQDDIFAKYNEAPLDKWTLFIKSPKHLGRFNTVAKSFILKREVQQFWAVYNELFTTPYYTVKTNFNDKTHRNNLINWLQARKHSGFAVVGTDDEISSIAGGGTGYVSYEAFKKDTNQDMSKAFLGSTMVLEDGSSRSQAEVHDNNTESFIRAKAVWIENIINEELIPKMQGLGLDISVDYTFKWVYAQKMTSKDWTEIIAQLSPHYDFEEKEITEKIGMRVDKKEQTEVNINQNQKTKLENVFNHLYNASTND